MRPTGARWRHFDLEIAPDGFTYRRNEERIRDEARLDGIYVIRTSVGASEMEAETVLGGTPVFVGTRVPVQTFLDYLRGGDTLDEFLQDFPSVNRRQAESALDLAHEALTAIEAGLA